ncbi:MAG: tetratricopeptide repeat protein [Rivularia sp. ALOHA_DT_140]|nr:tetratricopeptide repeat protein [Rivularia sp. ALOHA_DT_140]
MRYSLGLFTFISVCLVTLSVEGLVKDGFAVADEGIVIAQKQNLGKLREEAKRLYNLGIEQYEKNQFKEALNTFVKALVIYREIKSRRGRSILRGLQGSSSIVTHSYSINCNRSQNFFVLQRCFLENKLSKIKYRNWQGIIYNKFGSVYLHQGKYKKAQEFYSQALAIFEEKAVDDKIGRGNVFNNLAELYRHQNQYPKALELFNQALDIFKDNKNSFGIGSTLNNIGLIYNNLGQHSQALDFYQQALKFRQKANDRIGIGTTLHNIGFVYDKLGNYDKALKFYQQALAIRQAAKDREGKATTLNNIGLFYNQRQQYTASLQSLKQALIIFQELNYPLDEANTLDSLGTVYKSQGKYNQASEAYQKALTISQEFKDRGLEAIILSNIGDLLTQQNQPILAITFYKQSVSIYEQIRQGLRTLPKEQQESYTKTIAHTYRILADLLIQQDRILEAQQVLDLLKVRELKDYLRNVRGSGEKLVILRPEEEILKKYNQLQKSAIALGQELTELRKTPDTNRTQVQNQRIAQLVKLQTELNQQFNEFSQRTDIIALLDKLSRQAQKMAVDLSDLDALRDDLKRLNAVMLYPLILDDRLELVITTPDSPPLRRTFKVKRTELNKVITEFRQALQNPAYDVKTPAKQLYNWLIKPLENDLNQSKAKTIIYAPDGQLRYIPLSALYDGEQWLVENFRINNITAKSLTDFTSQPQPQPRVLAGAFVEGKYNIQVTGRNYPFNGLPYAGKEVENLTKILPKTTKLIDKAFSKEDTTVKMNEYNIVHLATHAAFVPGDASLSFILFGDGKIANLKEIGNWTLNNVDLVVLSACETGIGGKFGNGEEILGLGYQFQSRGARATIASLWQVEDGGTQILMNEFYNNLKEGKITKAEALRQAQMTLIKSQTNLEHPNYWAPFILIGNGL